MKYLWQDLSLITTILENSRTIILFLDFDGTLTPIVKSRGKVNLSFQSRNLLQELSNKSNLFMAIISGRKLEDIKKMVGLSNLTYGGNHGLEWSIFDRTDSYPIPEKTLSTLKEILQQLNKIAFQFSGVHIYDKEPVLSLHYRSADRKHIPAIKLQFANTLKPYIENEIISVMPGKMSFEVCPKVEWNKGYLAQLLTEKISIKTKKAPLVIAIGDDTTDEDMFKKLGQGITIKVGKSIKSEAQYYLKDVRDVIKFLTQINNVVKTQE